MMIEVDSHPFELDTMLFMDWRDDHTKVCSDPALSGKQAVMDF